MRGRAPRMAGRTEKVQAKLQAKTPSVLSGQKQVGESMARTHFLEKYSFLQVTGGWEEGEQP